MKFTKQDMLNLLEEYPDDIEIEIGKLSNVNDNWEVTNKRPIISLGGDSSNGKVYLFDEVDDIDELYNKFKTGN
tara:strand:- start:99 stop:320 length:222 start_codon:yes stop_codon:yes gene_type:complete